MQQPPQEAPVLVDDRTVEAEAPGHIGHRLGRGLPAGQEAGHVMGRHEEHHEHNDADHEQHDQPLEEPSTDEGQQVHSPQSTTPTVRGGAWVRTPDNVPARGSRASRTASPSRLKARVVMMRAAPGKTRNHHATW